MNIDITAEQKTELIKLLSQYLPNIEVWAFGSRVKGTARPSSDLDLVAFTSSNALATQQVKMSELREALEESSLPFRVDLLEWESIPESFKNNILQQYVVLIDSAHTSKF